MTQGQSGVETSRMSSRAAAAAKAFFIQQLSCVKLQKWTRLKKKRYQKMRLDSRLSSTTSQEKFDMTAKTGSVISKAPHTCHEYQHVHQLCTTVKQLPPPHKLCKKIVLVINRMSTPQTKTDTQGHVTAKWTKQDKEISTKMTADTKMSK